MNKFNDIAQEMREAIEEIERTAAARMDDLDDEGQATVRELADRTNTAITQTIEKLRDVAEKVKDDEKVNDFLDRAMSKCREAVVFTEAKINAVEAKPKVDLDAILTEIRGSFDKLMQNENVQNAAGFVKGVGEEINNYLNKPEVKDKIEKVKDVTISAAEKGLDVLKNVLTPEDKK